MRKQTDGEFWADKLMDAANLAVVTLVFSQLAADKINLRALLLGSVLYLILILIARYLRKKR